MINHKSNNKINKDNISGDFAVVISLFLILFCASVESRKGDAWAGFGFS